MKTFPTMKTFPRFIPGTTAEDYAALGVEPYSPDMGIPEGYYTQQQFVQLLRDNKHNPEVIQFLADMLED